MKTEITRIKLQLADREIELTATEARQVQKELNRLFEMEKTELQKFKEEFEKQNPKKEYVPYPVYHPPIIIDRQAPHWPSPWEIWCGTSGQMVSETPGTLLMTVGSNNE